jgi:hypothetical protein
MVKLSRTNPRVLLALGTINRSAGRAAPRKGKYLPMGGKMPPGAAE